MKSRFYCQLCKLGADSGDDFRAHLLTPAHRLQKVAYDRNPSAYTEYFSGKFARQFLEVLQKTFGSRTTNVNKVYLAYLTDSTRVRLTSTKWVTLQEFLDWLDENFPGRCTIKKDSCNAEIYIQLLKGDCQGMEHDRLQGHQTADKGSPKSDYSRSLQALGKRKQNDSEGIGSTDMKRPRVDLLVDDPFNISGLVKETFADLKKNTVNDRPKWTLSRNRVSLSFAQISRNIAPKTTLENDFEETHDASAKSEIQCDSNSCPRHCEQTVQEMSPSRSWRPSKLSLRRSALEELMKEQERERVHENRQRNWLYPGIVVKVVTNRLSKKYMGQHAVVMEVKHMFTALLRFVRNGTLLYADQSHIQPVLPAIGERVLIVNECCIT